MNRQPADSHHRIANNDASVTIPPPPVPDDSFFPGPRHISQPFGAFVLDPVVAHPFQPMIGSLDMLF